MLAPRGAGFEQTCSACHDPALRKTWGCDAPAPEPVAWVDPCVVCGGERQDCEACDGSGRMPVHRCPNQCAGPAERAVVMASLQVENGILPDEGGWQDQTHVFVTAYPLVAQEIARWREKHRDIAMRNQNRKR